MKILKLIIVAALLILSPVTGPVGCKNPNATAYKVVGSVQVGADVAMRAWGVYVAKNHPSVEAEQKVKLAYDRYRASAIIVSDAGKAFAQASSPSNQNRLDVALSAAAASLSDLTSLVQAFGVTLK